MVPPNEDEATRFAGPSNYRHGHGRNHSHYSQEVFVRPGAGWKGALARARVNFPSSGDSSASSSSSNEYVSTSQRPISAGNIGLETPDEPQEVLYSCRMDMIQLWYDQGIRDILRRKKIRLEDSSGFFLDDLERVTSLEYIPSDDDVLKARLKTVGVSEYKFEMEFTAGRDSGTEWRIVDVGGSRSQRPTWAPFFDDVDAIIFLAPISGFDQVLAEDKNVNRLEDSVLLWKAVCSNKLLANVDLVLFLNKCDLLEKKLNSGIQLSRYVRTYGDRGNDLDSVSKYLRGKFSAIHREYSPNPRKFYAFCTSVTDPATTAGIIASVRDTVIRQHLKQSKLL
jgi:guanine nucleotide-binding protein subunit alpha